MNQAQQVIDEWPAFISKFDLDPELGTLIKPDYEVLSFDFKKLKEHVDLMMSCNTQHELNNLIKNFPEIEIKEQTNKVDMLILHGYTVLALEKFLDYCRIINTPEEGAVLPKSIALPLHIAATYLNMSHGMGLGIQFNWTPTIWPMNYNTQQFGFDDFQIKTYITKNHKMEKMFLGGSIIGCYYMAKVMKLIYEINCIIEYATLEEKEVVRRLKKIKEYFQKIVKEIQIIIDQFDFVYFKTQLGNMIKGYQGLIFQGVENGQNKTYSAPSGSGGADCSYQVFDKAFGLTFQGGLEQGHQRLRTMMPKNYIDLIKYYEQNSMIRPYCDCTLLLSKTYNQVLTQYGQFIFLHQGFIRKFYLGKGNAPKVLLQHPEIKKPAPSEEINGFQSHSSFLSSQMLSLDGKK